MNFNLCKRLFFNTASLNPIQDGPFWGCSRMGGGRGGSQKKFPPSNLSHISYSNKTWHSYTLPKEDLKNI